MKKWLLSLVVLMLPLLDAGAQCAMCRSTLENNFSNGDPGLAAGLNMGILYLLALPYLAALTIGILWYKTTKNGQKKLSRRVA